jgi:prevent-host-death family protein
MPTGTSQFETTAAEISRNFGQWQDRALQAPVRVTHHGRPRVVIVSAGDFERLLADREDSFETPAWTTAAKEAEAALSTLMEGMAEGFIALDASLRITAANSVVAAFLDCSQADLIGRNVASIGDPARADVFLDRYRWVLRTGEAATFESTAHIRKDRTLRVRAFPFRGGVGVVLTNLTELAALRTAQADWNADFEALSGHPAIATARLNLMGFITTANAAFLEFLGFGAEQVAEVRLTDLAVATDRQLLAQGINDLLQQKIVRFAAPVAFLTRDHGRRAMSLSMAPRLRDLAFDGLSLVGIGA